MMDASWKKNPIAFTPKTAPVRDSWWTRPELQADRLAFQRQLVSEELKRLNASEKFGGSRVTHDKFQKAQS